MDLNYVSVKDKFPFPIIKDLLNELGVLRYSLKLILGLAIINENG